MFSGSDLVVALWFSSLDTSLLLGENEYTHILDYSQSLTLVSAMTH